MCGTTKRFTGKYGELGREAEDEVGRVAVCEWT